MSEPRALTYYQLDSHRDGTSGPLAWNEHPELQVFYTTPEQARAAGDVALTRVLDDYRQKLAAYQPMREPDAAKRAWDSEKKAACFTETRITEHHITWQEPERTRDGWVGTLFMGCQSRHRWREVEMRTEVAKNGTTTITHALGKALPWSSWSRDRQGGLYVPMQVQVAVRPHTLRLAATSPDELLVWLGGGRAR